MRIGFYLKLAWEGIRKNMRLYLPYLLTGAVMVMMYYIMKFLAESEMLKHMKGGSILRTMLPLGCWVVAIFSLIFLFYSNSLLIRQRNREFGLYNVLGMDKRNLGYLMFWENLFAAAISIVCGLGLGVGLSKLAELGMVNLLNEEVTYKFLIDWSCVGKTARYYGLIYVILLFNALIKIRRNNPLALLHSSNVGEKPPKGNWCLALIGVALLAGAYYIAVVTKNPLTASLTFFLAVIMVIIATYLLFISGSVVFCRLLQKNKKYYYKKNHFVSVSSMVYRMKRNGAGLASICILITMVLVMLSSVLSLYIGAEDSLKERYPQDISLSLPVKEIEQWNEDSFSKMRGAVDELVPDKKNVQEYCSMQVVGFFTEEGVIVTSNSQYEINSGDDTVGFLEIISLEQYNQLMGKKETLEDNECMLYCYRTEFSGDTFSIQEDTPMKVKKVLDNMTISGYASMQIIPSVFLVVKDVEAVVQPIMEIRSVYNNERVLGFFWFYGFDLDMDADAQIEVYENLLKNMGNIVIRGADGSYSYYLDGKESGRAEFYGLYGGLFFIGILLSIVFLFAAVLIIYYKQISEGYEDASRFATMRKVGMTKKNIRKSINSQVLTVFFVPLVLAGIHQAFAFPIVWKLLQLFNLHDRKLMIIVTVCSFVVFGVLYAVVYKLTANVYYRIVSGAK